MAGEEAPYLFRELEPARWREHLCAEPTTLLDALLAAEANGVVRLVNTNIKAPGTVAILERAPSDNALEHVEAVGKTMPGINDGLRPKIGQSAPSQLGSLRATLGRRMPLPAQHGQLPCTQNARINPLSVEPLDYIVAGANRSGSANSAMLCVGDNGMISARSAGQRKSPHFT